MKNKLSKTSTTYYLSEYLEDLSRAGVQDFYRGAPNLTPKNVQKTERPSLAASTDVADSNSAVMTFSKRDATKSTFAPLELASKNTIDFADEIAKIAASGVDRAEKLRLLAEQVSRCALCVELASTRTQTVFGSGNPNAELVFIGEGPGADEDEQGKPFVGRSGRLLTDMIEKGMEIPRESVFICNIVRCRPPENRNPKSEEAQACRPFLDATLEIIKPKFICCLGSVAATNLLKVDAAIGKLRGKIFDYCGAQVVCTYHPAYLLRTQSAKKQAWEDLQLLMRAMKTAREND